MTLYDKNGNLFDTSKFVDSMVAGDRKKEINEGKKTIKSIFLEDPNETLLKIFTVDNDGDKVIGNHYISKTTFDILKEVNNPNIVKLYDYYYFDNFGKYQIDAYTMEKVRSRKEDLLSEDKAILLDYLSDLQKLAKDLANKKIRMQDTNGANLIFTNVGPVVVDLDFYYKKALIFKNELETENKAAALDYFKNYAINNYLNLYDDEDKDEYTRKMNDLYGIFAMRINSNTDIVKEVNKNLNEYSISKQLKLKRTN